MVDAGAGVADFVFRRADPLGEHRGRALHAVAEAGGNHVRVFALHRTAEHRHGIGVVEVNGVGAVTVDVGGDVQDGVDRAQIAEDAARAARIADVRIYAVFLGNENIVLPDVHFAVEDRGHNAVGAHERFLAVERRQHFGRILALGYDAVYRALDVIKPLGVDVHQGAGRVLKGGEGEQVVDQLAREAEAACADECDFLTHVFTLLFRVYLKNSLRLHHGVFFTISASGNLDLAPLNLRFPSLN